jgi:hypothetical protein
LDDELIRVLRTDVVEEIIESGAKWRRCGASSSNRHS